MIFSEFGLVVEQNLDKVSINQELRFMQGFIIYIEVFNPLMERISWIINALIRLILILWTIECHDIKTLWEKKNY